ncbi:MAG: hypothetical protein IPN68_06730 [Bacteroidetes bacterium]|jgi:hypothetical protein|nr:hypothetical protein [Bacteroidota bacterium]
MKEFIKKYLPEIIFSLAGAIGGFLYWKFVGCLSGTCVIKSVWYLSTLYGGILGWIVSSLGHDLINSFRKEKKYDQ